MRSIRVPRVLLATGFASMFVVLACDDEGDASSTSSSSTGGATSASASETVGGGGAKAEITSLIEEAAFTVSCLPVAEADPVHGSFGAKYVNEGMLEGDVDIVSARILFTSNAKHLAWTFDATPETSGPVAAGQTAKVTHTKTDGSGAGDDPTLDPCDFCAGTAKIEVTWKSKQLQQSGEKSLGLVQCSK